MFNRQTFLFLFRASSARYYCWRTPGGTEFSGGESGNWCWVNVRCPSMYAHTECTDAKAWTLDCDGGREMKDQAIEEEKTDQVAE